MHKPSGSTARLGVAERTAAQARERLPAVVQDRLRATVDMVSPRRRGATRKLTVDELARRVSSDGVVLAGPFAGMRLSLDASWGGLAARLAGTYEEEIASQIAHLAAASPTLVADVGAAEGYYAVGLARLLPATPVVSFDIDPRAQRACRQNARLNGIDNLTVRGRATPNELARWLPPGALLVCDCEGYEGELLDPDLLPVLRKCSIVAELHEFARPGVTALVLQRFSTSHVIDLIDAGDRSEIPPHLDFLSPRYAHRAIEEGRPRHPVMQWAVMRPRGTAE
jgi:hypothetical protein